MISNLVNSGNTGASILDKWVYGGYEVDSKDVEPASLTSLDFGLMSGLLLLPIAKAAYYYTDTLKTRNQRTLRVEEGVDSRLNDIRRAIGS